MNIAIIIVITALVAIYIIWPFFLGRKSQNNEQLRTDNPSPESDLQQKLKSLDNHKENLYAAIKDIEFDYGLGKLSKEDFDELSNKYKIEAANVLKEIDQTEKQVSFNDSENDLEQEIASYRNTESKPLITEDTELEEEIAAFRSGSQSSLFCSECNTEYRTGDAFCSKCGAKLN